ncbi:hypothetical protein D1831_08085 [Lactiplantibacillus garii]|uniref:SWIM-type domain-containing protein n=1 Tax=Lactiplantibacillus garii TaxID=2306423 RepID=A0A426D6R2_9LACO|nr:hypothetical protein [Lactiplantibacillus garii]RRK10336.1 hypothetical protein D1831_08085 [Lactiplantibacillus garii]
MAWQSLFTPTILQRGWHYYQRGLVHDYVHDAVHQSATVNGTHHYHVALTYQHKHTSDLSCDCPYAKAGNHCKHMAALLYYVTKARPMTNVTRLDVSQEQLDQLMEQATDHQIKAYLRQLLTKDFDHFKQFQTLVFKHFIDTNTQSPSKQLTTLFHHFTDNEGRVTPSTAPQFQTILQYFFKVNLERLITAQKFKSAFNLSTHLFRKLTRLNHLSPVNTFAKVEADIQAAWSRLARQEDPSLNQYMFHWYCANVTTLPFPQSASVENLLFNDQLYTEPRELRTKLKLIDQKLIQFQNTTYHSPLTQQVGPIEWVHYRIAVMKDLRLTPKASQNFCLLHCNDPIVRDYYLESCRAKSAYVTALNYLRSVQVKAQEANDDSTANWCTYTLNHLNEFWHTSKLL